MQIERLTSKDAPRLVSLTALVQNLHAEQQPQRYNMIQNATSLEDLVVEHLAQPGALGLGVIDADEILGYLIAVIGDTPEHILFPSRRVVTLNEICVHPAHRRKGIADMLLNDLKERGRKEGATAIKSSYANFNFASEALLKKHGFLPVMISCEAPLT